MKIYPSYQMAEDLDEYLLNLKIKLIAYQDDAEELLRLYNILLKFDKDIIVKLTDFLEPETIRHIKLSKLV